jgi:response regulator NasT
LSAVINRAGGIVAIEHSAPGEALHALERARPDIAIVAPEAAWHGGSVFLRLRDQACCPIVLLAQRPSRRLLDEAREGGVMACLIEPVRAAQVALTLDLAVARFRDGQALRQALADRKVIERAKGLLMARYGLLEDDAFRRLRRSAMDTQRPLADIAMAVLRSDDVAAPA